MQQVAKSMRISTDSNIAGDLPWSVAQASFGLGYEREETIEALWPQGWVSV